MEEFLYLDKHSLYARKSIHDDTFLLYQFEMLDETAYYTLHLYIPLEYDENQTVFWRFYIGGNECTTYISLPHEFRLLIFSSTVAYRKIHRFKHVHSKSFSDLQTILSFHLLSVEDGLEKVFNHYNEFTSPSLLKLPSCFHSSDLISELKRNHISYQFSKLADSIEFSF